VARPKSDIQERILESAHQRFLAEGVDAASLRRIAKDAETSIGMVYYYYTTKDELFLAVVEETYQRLLADLEALIQKEQSYRERILGLYTRIGSLSGRDLEVLQLIIRESLTSNERRTQLVRRFLRGHLPLLMGTVLTARQSGELDKDIHPLVAMACSFGIGSVPLLMLRNASNHWKSMASNEQTPCVLRDTATELMESLPGSDALARTLSDIAMRALGVKQVSD
jgi:AcrR family transcriptional regulator